MMDAVAKIGSIKWLMLEKSSIAASIPELIDSQDPGHSGPLGSETDFAGAAARRTE
jgi:hypothetical protein